MEQTTFSKFIDRTFYLILLILLNILLINSIFNSRTFGLIAGSILGTLLFIALVQFLDSKNKIKTLQKAEQSILKKTFESLSVTNPKDTKQFFIDAFKKQSNLTISTIKDFIIVKNNKTGSSFALTFDFLSETAPLVSIFNFINNSALQKVDYFVFLANAFSYNTETIFNEKHNIVFYDKVDTYNLFKQLNSFPQIKQENSKRNRKEELKQTFSKINIRKFLTISILLFAISFFTPLKVYYRICASISLLLFVLCIIFKPKEQKIQNNLSPERIINL